MVNKSVVTKKGVAKDPVEFYECEVCGKKTKFSSSAVKIEGVEFKTCAFCAKLGKQRENMTNKNAVAKKRNANVRKLVINNYRNVGITFDNKEQPAELILNRGLEPEDLGDLIILVGPNNSGKSNVLAALEAFRERSFEEDDSPDFMYCEQTPSISMIVQDGDKKSSLKVEKQEIKQEDTSKIAIKNLKSEINILADNLGKERNKKKNLNEELGRLSFEQRLNSFDLYSRDANIIDSNIGHLKKQIEEKEKTLQQVNYTAESQTVEEIVEKIVENSDVSNECKYNDLLSSSIVVYNQKSISQKDLSCKPDNPTYFVNNIFKIMGKDPNVLDSAYKKYKGKSLGAHLKSFEKELNNEVPEKITKFFNEMYFCGEGEKYHFELDLESEKVHVNLYRGDVPLDLDKQSTGFKWFFDFFFNFAYKEDLKPGDIIVMDEPATNLHVSGQLELRKFLKELAQRNGLTFVISTHSPFLIDCNYLDELRLMHRNEHGHVTVENQFDLHSKNADKLDPILSNLTVGRHIITGAQKVIFVEGITDYNYLTAFKLLFAEEKPEYNSLTFLPVGGLSNGYVGDVLCDIDKQPIILVDADPAGLRAKKKCEGTKLTAVSLNELNPSYEEIESLFSSEDANRYNIENKEWNESSLFKKKIFENEITNETKDNFKKVLDYLVNL